MLLLLSVTHIKCPQNISLNVFDFYVIIIGKWIPHDTCILQLKSVEKCTISKQSRVENVTVILRMKYKTITDFKKYDNLNFVYLFIYLFTKQEKTWNKKETINKI
jgi:hypothetical protein